MGKAFIDRCPEFRRSGHSIESCVTCREMKAKAAHGDSASREAVQAYGEFLALRPVVQLWNITYWPKMPTTATEFIRGLVAALEHGPVTIYREDKRGGLIVPKLPDTEPK